MTRLIDILRSAGRSAFCSAAGLLLLAGNAGPSTYCGPEKAEAQLKSGYVGILSDEDLEMLQEVKAFKRGRYFRAVKKDVNHPHLSTEFTKTCIEDMETWVRSETYGPYRISVACIRSREKPGCYVYAYQSYNGPKQIQNLARNSEEGRAAVSESLWRTAEAELMLSDSRYREFDLDCKNVPEGTPEAPQCPPGFMCD